MSCITVLGNILSSLSTVIRLIRTSLYSYYLNIILLLKEPEPGVGAGFEICLEPEPENQKRTGSGNAGQISRAFHFRDRNVFVRLYKQYVMPHLEFAAPAWAPWTVADKQVLDRVQERAVKMVSGLDSQSYGDRLKELGMVSLEKRRHQTDTGMVQLYKILHGYDSVRGARGARAPPWRPAPPPLAAWAPPLAVCAPPVAARAPPLLKPT